VQATFWGVRGSIPAPGPETNRYGGNTSCVAVRTSAGALIILDCGTGAVGLGRTLMPQGFGQGQGVATMLLSHTHWDHIQGFAFFAPVFVPGNKLAIWGNARSSDMLEGILEGQMNPNFSPIHTLKNLGAQIDIKAAPMQGSFAAAGVQVRALANPHGAHTALAFRIDDGGKSLVYASDVGYPPSGIPDEAIAFYEGADLLIHDSTFLPEHRPARLSRGLSSCDDAAQAAARAGVRHLALFHYDQDYADDVVDDMLRRTRAALDAAGASGCQVTAAAEGLTITL
jgi:phosphoribosyl 1,2-cyclic phosphodiesterase